MVDVAPILEALVETSGTFEQGFVDHRGPAESENESGDSQYAADVWMDEVLFDALADLDAVGTYLSEERPEAVDVGEGLGVAIDPLDGSSNLAVNNAVGTVLGIYDSALPASGRDLVAGAYLLYGPMTTMTVATADSVDAARVVDDAPVERRTLRDGGIVDAEPLEIPAGSDVAGIAGQTNEWSPALREFVDEIRRDRKLRYTGAMVADVENVLARGGLAAYPSMKSSPEGVIRLQYESNPVAYILERAGGRSSTGNGSILDAEPGGLHERIPSFFGTPSLIDDLEAALE